MFDQTLLISTACSDHVWANYRCKLRVPERILDNREIDLEYAYLKVFIHVIVDAVSPKRHHMRY